MSEPIHEDHHSPQEKRRLSTERRLHAALERLLAGKPRAKSLCQNGNRITVSTLAREANVSRNTIYATHRSFVEDIARRAGHIDEAALASREQGAREHRRQSAELRRNVRDLVSQHAALLKRALDAEHRADQLAARNASLVAELAALRMPVAMTREE